MPTIERLRRRFVEEGLEAALKRQPRPYSRQRRLDGEQEAHLIALACTESPTDQGRWSLRLLAQRMVTLGYVESISYETVRRTLKKTPSNRGSTSPG
ncbi:MAG: helix-turn-helix domain-containing protein [Cyanobacteria bacterium Co-bin13]|nr:helix-turn-helix domain-containing protein [Cyanobacteria bacterium Co-bin13]